MVLSTGKLEVLVNGQRVNILEPGAGFGELALLHDTPRTASVVALEKCGLWGVDRNTFRSAVESVNALNYLENKTFIENVPLLKMLTTREKDAMVGALDNHKFEPGTRIVNEGDPGELFFIIKEGTVSC
jgi:cGMP-dependent protein kinase